MKVFKIRDNADLFLNNGYIVENMGQWINAPTSPVLIEDEDYKDIQKRKTIDLKIYIKSQINKENFRELRMARII